MKNKPKKISEELLFSSPYRNLVWKNFQIKNWEIHKYVVIEQIPTKFSTMVLPITKEKEIILCREFKYWIEKFVYLFPVWILEKDLTEIENVLKELKEESWYISDNITYLWETMIWNYDTTTIRYYIAKDCIFWKQELEIWEYIKVSKIKIEDFEKMIAKWEILCPLRKHWKTN
jgi:hypothetical protein